MSYRALKRLMVKGEYIEPGETVDLSHLDEGAITKLLAKGAIAAMRPKKRTAKKLEVEENGTND